MQLTSQEKSKLLQLLQDINIYAVRRNSANEYQEAVQNISSYLNELISKYHLDTPVKDTDNTFISLPEDEDNLQPGGIVYEMLADGTYKPLLLLDYTYRGTGRGYGITDAQMWLDGDQKEVPWKNTRYITSGNLYAKEEAKQEGFYPEPADNEARVEDVELSNQEEGEAMWQKKILDGFGGLLHVEDNPKVKNVSVSEDRSPGDPILIIEFNEPMNGDVIAVGITKETRQHRSGFLIKIFYDTEWDKLKVYSGDYSTLSAKDIPGVKSSIEKAIGESL